MYVMRTTYIMPCAVHIPPPLQKKCTCPIPPSLGKINMSWEINNDIIIDRKNVHCIL